jgi:hypothetical protein
VLQKIGFMPTGRIVSRMSLARGREVPCVLYAMDLGDDEAVDVPTAMRPQQIIQLAA